MNTLSRFTDALRRIYPTALASSPISWLDPPRDHVRPKCSNILIRGNALVDAGQLCTDLSADSIRVLEWFMLPWQLEVTPYPVRGRLFQEVWTHLGMETQRQWSDLSIARATPVLLGLFSWTTLAPLVAKATLHDPAHRGLVRQTVADLRGRHCPGATPPVAGAGGFFTVRSQHRYAGTPGRSVPPTCRFSCLRRLKCGKSSFYKQLYRCNYQ